MVKTKRTAAVVGSGINGLSCAYQLATTGWDVTVISADPLLGTTSAVAAAIWWPYDPGPRPAARTWALATLQRFRTLATATPEAGVRMRHGHFLNSPAAPAPWFVEVVDRLNTTTTDDDLALTVPIIDMPVHLQWLAQQCQDVGVRFETRRLSSLEELGNFAVVINCAGFGSKALASDPTLQPLRGQVVIMKNTGIEEFTKDLRHEGVSTYIYPRLDTTVLGGTLERTSNLEPDDATTASIIERCAQLDARVKDGEVVDVRVGLRPHRGVIRLELENLSRVPIIHNYGHGLSGVSLSWGCAQRVVQLCNSWDFRAR